MHKYMLSPQVKQQQGSHSLLLLPLLLLLLLLLLHMLVLLLLLLRVLLLILLLLTLLLRLLPASLRCGSCSTPSEEAFEQQTTGVCTPETSAELEGQFVGVSLQ